jgi:hypothetical protein
MALDHNAVSSLHVALSCACAAAYAGRCGRIGKALLGTWAAAIALSTLLTHQHHLLDVVTAIALAAAGKWLVYDRWCARAVARRTQPAGADAIGFGEPALLAASNPAPRHDG